MIKLRKKKPKKKNMTSNSELVEAAVSLAVEQTDTVS
jgi:hypothetical protein